ncbi:MAG: dTDP-4-dehydrorhamnose reductase, partial [Acidobacteriota bacterium]|nr:dTDP-4-dehydrorhamnose reductase [Acidobacteriota bacterium]
NVRVLVTGAGGMVGRAVSQFCKASGDVVLSYDHRGLDIGDPDSVLQTLQNDKPEVVINCAAWTDVDGCELNEERAFEANARGPENLARASREIDAVLVTISSDYVFDGKKNGFYTQRDQPHPESIYAKSKLEGERRAQLTYARTIVVRTGFVFGQGGNNFLSTIVERARKGERLKAISDAYGTPTYAVDLAGRLRELSERDLPGIYHVVNGGEGASFEDFTREAIRMAGCSGVEVEAVSMDSLKRPAPRPRNSRLRCLLSEAIGLPRLRDWRHSLHDFVEQHYLSNAAEEAMR